MFKGNAVSSTWFLMVLFLQACTTNDTIDIINPNALPAEQLATVVGGQNRDIGNARISKVFDQNGQLLSNEGFLDERYYDRVNIEAGNYTIEAYCNLPSGFYASPKVNAQLNAGESYKLNCESCYIDGKQFFLNKSAGYMSARLVPLLQFEHADFETTLDAAKRGNDKAKLVIAQSYFSGVHSDWNSVKQDYIEAYAWASLAVSAGYSEAEQLLQKIMPMLDDLDKADMLANQHFKNYWHSIRSCGGEEYAQRSDNQNLEVRTADRKVKVILYHKASSLVGMPVGIKINGKFIKNLSRDEYVQIFLSPKQYNLNLSHQDAFTFENDYQLEVGADTMYIRVFNGFTSTKYEVQSEKPVDFHQNYIRAKRF